MLFSVVLEEASKGARRFELSDVTVVASLLIAMG